MWRHIHVVYLSYAKHLHNKRMFNYLNRSPSHQALSADVSLQRQKDLLQLQQSGMITAHKNVDIHTTYYSLP